MATHLVRMLASQYHLPMLAKLRTTLAKISNLDEAKEIRDKAVGGLKNVGKIIFQTGCYSTVPRLHRANETHPYFLGKNQSNLLPI